MREPQRLIQINRLGPGGAGPVLSYPAYRVVREASDSLADVLATSRVWRWNVRLGSTPTERVAGELVSDNYFTTLGVVPAVGRLLTPKGGHDGAAGASDSPVVVLSHAYWMRRFNGNPRVAGAALSLNGTPVTVVGVADRRFTGLERGDPVDMWAPLGLQPRILNGPNWLEQTGNNWLRLLARLKAGATPERTREMAHAAFRRDIEARGQRNEERIVVVDGRRGLSNLHERIGRPMAYLAVLVALVLLTACVNVATLHLGRAAHRERELAVRLTLGGGRARLVRQLITENLLLSGIGAVLALVLAWATRDVLLALLFPASERAPVQVELDARVFLFTAALGVLSGLLAGVLPARLAWRLDLNTGLKQLGSRTTERLTTLRGFLLPSAQIALTFVLLLGAALFARSFQSLRALDPGLTVIGIATLQQHVDRSLGQDRLVSTLTALFGGLALVLTCTGIYGALGYGVTRRTREIGVRLALGATRAQVRWMIARRGVLMLGYGLLVGVPAALGAAHLVRGLLFQVSTTDGEALTFALLGLLLATALANLRPRARSRADRSAPSPAE